MGLTTPPHKNPSVTETEPSENRTDEIDDELRNRNGQRKWKTKQNIGTWNLRSLNRPGAREELQTVLEKYEMDIVALQEVRWPGNGATDLSGGRLYYSGRKDGRHEQGVGFYVRSNLIENVIEFDPITNRLARLRVRSAWLKISMVVVHAPIEDSTADVQDAWYDELNEVMAKIPRHDLLLVLGDWNAKIGKGNDVAAFRDSAGNHSLHDTCSDNGLRLLSWATQHGLVVGGTIFPHREIHKGTWLSPDTRTVNQIDHILIRRRFRTSLLDVRNRRGAECNSDHYLVHAKVKIKLAVEKKKVKRILKYDTEKLKDNAIRDEYQIEVRNRFEALRTINDDIQWEDVARVIKEAAGETLGYEKKDVRPGTMMIELGPLR